MMKKGLITQLSEDWFLTLSETSTYGSLVSFVFFLPPFLFFHPFSTYFTLLTLFFFFFGGGGGGGGVRGWEKLIPLRELLLKVVERDLGQTWGIKRVFRSCLAFRLIFHLGGTCQPQWQAYQRPGRTVGGKRGIRDSMHGRMEYGDSSLSQTTAQVTLDSTSLRRSPTSILCRLAAPRV